MSAFRWGGAICEELLKNAAGQSALHFSHFSPIHKLRMFIGSLEWVRPTDGNYKLSGRFKKVITKILDHVAGPTQQDSAGYNFRDAPFDPMLISWDDSNGLDCLNTVDWTQGSLDRVQLMEYSYKEP